MLHLALFGCGLVVAIGGAYLAARCRCEEGGRE